MIDQPEMKQDWGERTQADLSSLLVELGRVLRALRFYGEADPTRADAVDRSYLAMRGELDRAGALELWIDERSFRVTGVAHPVPHGHLVDVAEALRGHGVERVQFTPDLSSDSFRAFVDLLSRGEQSLEPAAGFARGLAARSSAGIVINGGEEDALAAQVSLSSTPAVAAASLGSALLARSNRLVIEEEAEAEKLQVEDNPLRAPVSGDRGERLLFRLIELDRSSDDAAYEFLSRRIVEWAKELFGDGLADECYRAILVLSDHSMGDGGRSGLQARVADGLCKELASEERLVDLIDRASSDNVRTSVRATQVLLQLGEQAARPIFERLSSEQSAERAAQLTAILITLGEAALPLLMRAMGEPSNARAALAVRLGGELQNPVLVPDLVKVLEGSRPALRRDAARSLAHIGGDTAIQALTSALGSDEPEIPEVAAMCLAALGSPRSAQPVMAALESALRERDTVRARELIRSLGQLGSERAVPKLVALMERRSLLRRRPLRELKLAALGALARLPGREALRSLERASGSSDAEIRARATQLLARESGSGSEGVQSAPPHPAPESEPLH